MKNNIAAAVSILAFTACMILTSASAPLGEAAMPRGSSSDLASLKICIIMLNKDAGMTMEAGLVAKKRLSDKYDLTLGQVDGLLNRNIEYGDLAAVVTFAKEMRGGVKDENINKVMNLRQSGMEWDQIAEKLNLDLSDIAGALSRFEDGTHSRIKEALVEFGLPGTAAGGTGASGR
jgi:hypothetical protein